MDTQNFQTYGTAGVVNHYTQLKELQPAERMLLSRFGDRLSSMKMLDIGVGGGRTTQHFCRVVASYTGIDYSPPMIAACQQRFADVPQAQFRVCDAREMGEFADQSFDLILFSFNGLDYVSHCNRLQILQEVARIGKPGGYFYFSSHNLQALEQNFNLGAQLSWNPLTTYTNLVMWGILRVMNWPTTLPQIKGAEHLIVRDESHNFRLQTYYLRPKEQVHQLTQQFEHIEVYSWKSEQKLENEREQSSNMDSWLYYLCVIQ